MKNMKKYVYAILLSVVSFYGHAQSAIQKGQVIDSSSGNPVTGASVYTAHSGGRTITNDSGYFGIVINPVDSVLVERVGYKGRLVPIGSNRSSLLVIRMAVKDTTDLKDVELNTGYQSIPKERATGSFVQIDNKLLNRSVGPDILDRLKGVTSSLLFDANPNHPPITIRGLGTLTTGNGVSEPLIIVDNFPYTGDISNINPNDVENITILRDAAAASIWGAKAGNGVIVITTKKARQNQPTHLSINSNITVQDKPDLFDVSQMTTKDYIDVEKFLFGQGFYDAALQDNNRYPVVSPVVQILEAQKLGQISSSDADATISKLQNIDVRNGYLKYFYQRATMQQYSAMLSGGKENMAYTTSIGYDKDLSSKVGNKNDRVTLHSNLTIQPIRKLSLQTNAIVTWTRATMNNPLPINPSTSTALYPYTSFVDTDGKPTAIEKDYSSAFKDTAGAGHLLDWNYIPLDELHNADNTISAMDVLLNAQATYSFLPVLKGELKYQFERQTSNRRNYYSQLTYYARNLINLYTQINGNTVTYGIPVGGILDLSSTQATTHNVRAQLDYTQDFSRHHITALAGWELRQTNTTGNSSRTYGYDDDNLTYMNVDFARQFPILDGLPYSLTIPNNNSFTGLLDRILSLYANASYNFDNRYTFSVSARKDASNILGTSTNNKWKPLWSAGGAWNLSNEKFYRVGWLPSLKLRLTYGYSGNVNNTIAALTTLWYWPTNSTGISTLPYAMISNYPNADLRWEKIGTLNIATDFTVAKNILSGTIEYYSKKSTDVISGVPADITLAGIESLMKNGADLKGHGLDVTLNAVIINKGFLWSSNFLLSYDKVIVSKYKQTATPNNLINAGGGSITPVVGQPPYVIASYKWGGLDAQGNPQGYLNDTITEDYNSIITKAGWNDITINGSAVPQWFGSLRNTFSYKQFQLSFNITYKMGYYFRKNTISYNGLFNGGPGNGDYDKRWQKPGDEKSTNVPSMIYPDNNYRDQFYTQSTAAIESGDHVRFQDIRLSYDLKHTSKQPAIEFYLYANNLGVIWRKNKDHLDPDTFDSYPDPKAWSVGCKIDF